VLAISADADRLAAATAAGVSSLAKPFDAGALLACLRTLNQEA
jgi:hypothetical protein